MTYQSAFGRFDGRVSGTFDEKKELSNFNLHGKLESSILSAGLEFVSRTFLMGYKIAEEWLNGLIEVYERAKGALNDAIGAMKEAVREMQEDVRTLGTSFKETDCDMA